MSTNGTRRARPLGPHAVRVRNWCLIQLAVHRGLPAPGGEALSRLGDDEMSLAKAVALLEATRRGAPRARWRSRRTMIGAVVVVLALLALGTQRWLRPAVAAATVWSAALPRSCVPPNPLLGDASPRFFANPFARDEGAPLEAACSDPCVFGLPDDANDRAAVVSLHE
jgi:hypothetical protein